MEDNNDVSRQGLDNEINRLNQNALIVKPANQWMEESKKTPIPQKLFDTFWFEGELCILFSDTNLGKSILAVQLAQSISAGAAIPGFAFEAQPQRVIYFDFEMSPKQFETRYSANYSQHYDFDKKLFRAEINGDTMLPDTRQQEQFIFTSIKEEIEKREATVLIIDNITYLKNETEKANHAQTLMHYLKGIKRNHNLSILALAHTPKRDLTKELDENDLQGSKNLINFCDSCFAIGRSHNDAGTRYLKQIKCRNGEVVYGAHNVALCQINKPHNFLQFEFVNHGREADHIKSETDNERQERVNAATELRKQGISNREIGRRLGVSEMAVRKWFKKMDE